MLHTISCQRVWTGVIVSYYTLCAIVTVCQKKRFLACYSMCYTTALPLQVGRVIWPLLIQQRSDDPITQQGSNGPYKSASWSRSRGTAQHYMHFYYQSSIPPKMKAVEPTTCWCLAHWALRFSSPPPPLQILYPHLDCLPLLSCSFCLQNHQPGNHFKCCHSWRCCRSASSIFDSCVLWTK